MAKQYDESGKVDKGFVLLYWKLSYRRKFYRTLWVLPFGLLACYLVYHFLGGCSIFLSIALYAALALPFLAQLVYTYIQWKRGN
jgi:hypothetical protein